MPRYKSYSTSTRRRYSSRFKSKSYLPYGPRKSYKRRSEFRKKTQRPTFSKRQDYPQLQHDVMLASKSPVMGAVESADSTIAIPDNGIFFTIWSPTYRVANTTGRQRDRQQTNCLFVGVKENILFAGEGNFLHRRIVFWSRSTVEDAKPFSGPNEMLLRNIKLRDPNTDTTLDQFLGGSRGTDFLPSTVILRKFDSNMVDVVYDKNDSYTQMGTKLKTRKFWHRCEREISYQDKEKGVDTESSGWAGLTSGSGGNLYVVDLFKTRSKKDVSSFVTFASEVYWRERNT